MSQEYRLEEMSPEEGKALTAELQEVLKKYDAEMGVTSSIQLLKRVHNTPAPADAPVVSPIQEDDLKNGPEETSA